MNIEEIKERLEQLLPNTKYVISDFKEETFKWASNYQNDVIYLLSIIEQAEKALLAYQEFEQRSNCNWCGDGVRDVVNKALQAIRGN